MARTTISHYEVLQTLGKGGMGVVYQARDQRLDRLVALKVLPPEKVADPERKRRFVQEAKAASALNHPHIVTVYDIDCVDGIDFIAMELVQGRTLAQSIGPNGLELHEALEHAVDIAGALAAAHRAGIIHRDLKPANVMISDQGAVKLLDFGLAKLTETAPPGESAATATVTVRPEEPTLTKEGTVVGTAGYMSPEQVEGKKLDVRSDVFSFGAVLYEMLTGRRAFQGESAISTMSAILRESPAPLRKIRADSPADLECVLARCLEKDREFRYPSAVELQRDLVACQTRLSAREVGIRSLIRRPLFAIPAVAVLVAVIAAAAWLWVRNSRIRWALDVALPEITQLAGKRDYAAAFRLAQQAGNFIPANRRLAELMSEISTEVSIETSEPQAEIHFKEYTAPDSQWQPLGRSPILRARVPLGVKRWRIAKQGFQTVDAAASPELDGPSLKFTLDKEGSIPSGMVRIGGGATVFLYLTGLDHLQTPPLADFLMDRHEVTNKQFADFVAKGGYRTPAYWKQPFTKAGRALSWQEAMAEFRDSTGRPGPATWELGTFSAGQEDLPVSGVSWYEAAAYAEFAGKSLPTIYHWNRAAFTTAGLRDISPIVRLSNFGGRGPAPVGKYTGLNPYGTLDLAGNVKEWCWNAADERGTRRYILGGAWNEPVYMFNDPDAQSAFDRLPTYGFRCVKYLSEIPAKLGDPAECARRDYQREKPVSDETFRIYRSFFQYDKTGLDPVVQAADQSPEYWRTEMVTFNAAYGGERVTAYLFLPKGGEPPYQTVVFFPPSSALRTRSFERFLQSGLAADFIVRSGRAVMFPVYKSTFERGDGLVTDRPNLTASYREHVTQWYKDFARSIDYLATRKDIDITKLGYYGTSWGAVLGPILLAQEERIKAAVWVVGGFWQQKGPPESEQINSAPRVRIPVLMLNGRYDFVFPVETSQAPMFRFLGTPEKQKRHLLFESGHSVPRKELITEALEWFDRYLGPVGK